MLWFESDYTVGAHPEVLAHLTETNHQHCSGYGNDPFCHAAEEKIKTACGCPDGQVFFLTGGTQTNMTVISTMLKPYEGVIAASSGHIGVHEAGAIEASGHKVIMLPEHQGKLNAVEMQEWLEIFYKDESCDHMVYPGMVYLSWPTEYGTLYTRQELSDIRALCDRYHMRLYIDGARLGYGLYSPAAELTLPELSRLCDAFYIGGTKVGALCGEALVFPRHNAPEHFFTMQKQKGAVSAKARLAGVQFDALFTDGLYERISRHVLKMAELLKEAFVSKGYDFAFNSPTNQQFVILENTQIPMLREKVVFECWGAYDQTHTVCRFVTGWATTESDIAELKKLI